MASLIKCPLPKNWKFGKVSLSAEEVDQVRSSHFDRLIILKYGQKKPVALLNKPISQQMVASITKQQGDYYLMTYRF